MALNIAIVTNEMPHHKYFAAQLCALVNVKAVIHPQGNSYYSGRMSRAQQSGLGWFGLKAMSKAYNKFVADSCAKDYASAETQFFADTLDHYEKLNASLIHRPVSANTVEATTLMRDNEIDIICCLGGEILKADFIASARVACLNIHSGVSPFYNGSASCAWAVAEGCPNFTGVTLMHMNERVDGGKIIAHHLPEIERGDTSGSLFMKGIKGSVDILHQAISHAEKGELFTGIPQQRSFKYTTGMDWNIYQDLKLKQFMASGRMESFSRNAHTQFYENKHLAMDFPYDSLLARILAKPR